MFGNPNAIILMVASISARWFEMSQIDLLIEQMSEYRAKIVYLTMQEAGER